MKLAPADMVRAMDEKGAYPEELQDFADKAAVFLQEDAAIDPDMARAIAWKLAEYMRREWGGRELYFPKGISWECTQRDREIFARFNGENYEQLAREEGLTVMRIRQIVNAVRAYEMAKRQQTMF
jgi:Mor family transcriptional regulator